MPQRTQTFDDTTVVNPDALAVKTNGAVAAPGERGLALPDEDVVEERYMTPDDLLAISDLIIEEMVIPEWVAKDGRRMKIYLYSLDAAERDKYLNTIQYTDKRGRQKYDLDGSNARLVSLAARDEHGNTLFKGPARIAWLQQRNARVIERIAKRVRAISGLNQEDDEEEERRREFLD